MAHGGKRPNSGRKPKADEIKLIEQMDAVAVPEHIWRKLYERCDEGDVAAIKTWLSYRFGMPKQSVDHTTAGEKINQFDPSKLSDDDLRTIAELQRKSGIEPA